MSPWPPEGEPSGKGTKPVTLPRPGHADLAGVLKYGHDDVRDALERASARHTAVLRRRRRGREGAARASSGSRSQDRCSRSAASGDDWEAAIDAARADRDTLGGIVEVRAAGVLPGLGSYATSEDRLDARLAGGADGDPGGEGRSRSATASRSPCSAAPQAHDEIARAGRAAAHEPRRRDRGAASRTARSSSSAPAMKPLPTLMRPLALRRPRDRRAGAGARRAQRRRGGRGARRRRRGGRRVGARARGAREVRRRRARRHARGASRPTCERIRAGDARARPSRRARRLHGRGQVDARRALAERLGRPFVDLDREIERRRSRSREIFETGARRRSGCASRSTTVDGARLDRRRP